MFATMWYRNTFFPTPLRLALRAQLQPFIHPLRLLWGRMGVARVYVVLGLSVFGALAGVGVWHLIWPGKHIDRSHGNGAAVSASQSENARSAPASLSHAAGSTPAPETTSAGERAIAITEVKQTKSRGRRGERLVVATIGLTPRSNAKAGEVEIRVFFYDVTRKREMRPTDAQVTYQWLTENRDWNDPTPKFLAATYLKPPRVRRSSEGLRYGGFLVRVYAGGKLQDERSEPEGLLVSLREARAQTMSANQPSQTANTPGVVPVTTEAIAPPIIQKSVSTPRGLPQPLLSASPKEERISADTTLPYGKPVPGKPGFVSSPADPKFMIDVRGFPPGTLVTDPNNGAVFRVP